MQVAAASEDEVARAQWVALMLAGFGAQYLMHGLLMLNTPALAAVRAAIDHAGMGELLQGMAAALLRPQGISQILPACLDENMAALCEQLQGVLAEHAEHGIMCWPGLPHDREQYMHDWITTLHALADGTGSALDGAAQQPRPLPREIRRHRAGHSDSLQRDAPLPGPYSTLNLAAGRPRRRGAAGRPAAPSASLANPDIWRWRAP